MKGLVVILLGCVLIIGGCAAKQNAAVTVICDGGPTVEAPIMEKALKASGAAGDMFDDMATGNEISTVEWVRLLLDIKKVWRLFGANTVAHMNGNKLEEAEKYQRQIDANKAASIALCCPADTSDTDQGPPTTTPGDGGDQWDPKDAAITNGTALTGADLAADAALKAGFPTSEVPMAVAVARYESTFNPHPKTNVAMRGMWQIHWAVHPELYSMGDAYDPYVNARMALSVWEAAGKSWSPWSAAPTARKHVGEYARYGQAAAGSVPSIDGQVETTVPSYCEQPTTTTDSGDLTGTISQVASLNPAGAGNWQGAVQSGSYWYVAHATAGNRTQVFHRLDSAGVEVDHMTAAGFAHATSFAVVGSTVYATDNRNRVVTFRYRAGATIRPAQTTDTGWRGFISKDPDSDRVVIRNGNKYQAYSFTTHQPIGKRIVTPTGMRQGFSIAGDVVYTLSGATNQPASVDSYNVTTGQHIATRDVTSYGAGRAREPEGLYGATFGVKTGVGDARRLKMYQISAATTSGGTSTPASFNTHGNPRTVEQAMAWYQQQVDQHVAVKVNSCANAVARAYGWSNGGCYGPNCSALEVWGAINSKWKHPGKSDPPRGALVFWKTGSKYGHVAVSAGGGMIYTTDSPQKGRFGLVPISTIDKWGPRVGWSDPTWPIHTGSGA